VKRLSNFPNKCWQNQAMSRGQNLTRTPPNTESGAATVMNRGSEGFGTPGSGALVTSPTRRVRGEKQVEAARARRLFTSRAASSAKTFPYQNARNHPPGLLRLKSAHRLGLVPPKP
jgi:hypothetical protein